MLYVEYDWTSLVYRMRFGTTFIDCRGERSWPDKPSLLTALKAAGFKLGKKTDTRTWRVKPIAKPAIPADQ